MPLHLIRQDLTTMDCDAIVNPSNVQLEPGGGLDAAIHKAAGPSLRKACRDAAPCPMGQSRVTPAFRLKCRWVIHTAAPVWRGGLFGEKKLLAACYQSCVQAAKELDCQTLAVPLLGAGRNGIPTEKVLSIALETLEVCLADTDLTVFLVVYDKKAFTLSKGLHRDVQSYIDDNYVIEHRPKSRAGMTRRFSDWAARNFYEDTLDDAQMLSADEDEEPDVPELSVFDEDAAASAPQLSQDTASFELNASAAAPMAGMAAPPESAAAPQSELDFLLQLDAPFPVKLMKLIDQKGMDDVACYKKANVSRQTWYKILNEKGYKPNKKTVLSFAVALELTLEETQTLLESVGFVLSGSSLFDVILMYCLSHGVYDTTQIDAILFQYDQETLYSKA